MRRRLIRPLLFSVLFGCAGQELPDGNRAETPPEKRLRGSDSVVLWARIDRDPRRQFFEFQAYHPSGPATSGLCLQVLEVRLGDFPHPLLGISTHSGTMLERFMLDGSPPETTISIRLEWDPRAGLYRVEEFHDLR